MNLAQRKLLPPGETVVVGVSGGVDSMLLLRLLSELAGEFQVQLRVAHFNHQLRGTEGDGDEAFVRAAAEALKLPFSIGTGDVRAYAKEAGISIEMAARELRHGFLTRVAKEHQASRIALAHHANDQVETFWLRVLRGDVGNGLTGMRWERPAARDESIRVVRPFLNISKSEILDAATALKLDYRHDASNDEMAFQRNRLRLEILPLLQSFQPALEETTIRAAEVLADEKEFLTSEAKAWLKEKDVPFEDLPRALQRESVRLQLLQLQVQPSFDRIEALRLRPGEKLQVAQGLRLMRENSGRITALRDIQISLPPFAEETSTSVDLRNSASCRFGELELSWQFLSRRGEPAQGVEFFDAEKVGARLFLRRWQPGDRFQPIGLPTLVKLQDLFTNLKVPKGERHRRIIAATPDGRIAWVEGLRISEQFKVTDATRNVLGWKWRRIE